jgi:hypothetical protein
VDEEERGGAEGEGFTGEGEELVLLANTAELVEPGDGAFDDPAARENTEAFLVLRLGDLWAHGRRLK